MTHDFDTSLQRANAMQRMAADPAHSVFVSANAGSGKTRVLVGRVSRLLLAGTPPDKILCLTYTKAAAAEMQSRLFEALGEWAVLDGDTLQGKLNTLEGVEIKRSAEALGRARLLFARALETPGGLKVQTIHAFCVKLLRQFPLEAGLLPGTDAIDDVQSGELQTQVWRELEQSAVDNPDSVIANAITLLASHKQDEAMEKLYGWAMGNVYKMQGWKDSGGMDVLATTLGLDVGASVESIKSDAWDAAPKTEIKAAAIDMQGGGKTDVAKAEYIFNALTATTSALAYDEYVQVFFTKGGTPNKSMVTAKAGLGISVFGTQKEGIKPESERMIAAQEHVLAANVLEMTGALYVVSQKLASAYRGLKTSRRVMDFNDQIYMARGLLMDGEAREWVRYKLDGGVEHILVDEAQDTSGVQWDIVSALSGPFFQASPDVEFPVARTLFAVGDEKQSIYGFQGAAPELFLKKIQELTLKKPDTPDVKMSMSFRSTAQILTLVDEVFYGQNGIAETFDMNAVTFASDMDGHSAHRTDTGMVEFWPAVKKPPKPDEEIAFKPIPVDAPSEHSPREQLARQIAVQIKTWLDTKETVFERGVGARPMRARDIMILVTKRGDFSNGVIRNLKTFGVPVAGADRLLLSDSIAIQDLLSLAKFCLLSSDDLSLAEVLKSPLFNWDDDKLFDVAARRNGDLWLALSDGVEKETLKDLRKLSRNYAPYEFFARTLSYVFKADGKSILQRIYDRIGIEAADAIDAFLQRALAHQRNGAPSLVRFVHESENDEKDIKRDMDTTQDEVRVMTVHGAKGLEAPVVILPDTTQIKKADKDIVLPTPEGGFVMRVSKAQQSGALAQIQDIENAKVTRESMRLLYVALTRAESRLLICGYESNGKVAEGSWHERIEKSLVAMDAQIYETAFGDGLRYGENVTGETQTVKREDIQPEALPEWARILSAPMPKGLQYISPSKLVSPDEDGLDWDVAVRSPLAKRAKMGNRFSRGNHIHKLLQVLPELAVGDRRAAATRYLDLQKDLPSADLAQIGDEVFAVLENENFAPFFGQGGDVEMSLAEVSLAGGAKTLPAHIRLSGQIDRLCVIGDMVWILDYKSNRPPPMKEDDIAVIYIRQMAAYRALARDIFPNKKIKTALLWTDAPRLMPLSDRLLDSVDWDVVLPS